MAVALTCLSKVANRRASVGISKGNRSQQARTMRRHAGCLIDPGLSAIDSVENLTIISCNGRSMIYVCKRNAVQKTSRTARLTGPIQAAVCCIEDCACLADSGSVIRIGKGDALKQVASASRQLVWQGRNRSL
jgi:hypothetical protein